MAQENKKKRSLIPLIAVLLVIAFIAGGAASYFFFFTQEKKLYRKLKSETDKPVIEFYYDDFNNNGSKEGFGIAGNGDKDDFSDGEVWFVNDKDCKEIKDNINGKLNGIIEQNGRKLISIIDGDKELLIGLSENNNDDSAENVVAFYNDTNSETETDTEQIAETKISYSGISQNICHSNGIDYCAGLDGKFYAVTATDKVLLSDQNCTGTFNIINDTIYYSVLNSVESIKHNWAGYSFNWAKCSLWKMNLDGSSKQKIFDCNGCPEVAYADDNFIFYNDDDLDSFKQASEHYTAKLYKYDIKSDKSERIGDESDNFYNFKYCNDSLICSSKSWDGPIIPMNIIDIKTGSVTLKKETYGFKMLDNGKIIYSISDDSENWEIVSYDTNTGESETIKQSGNWINIFEPFDSDGKTVYFYEEAGYNSTRYYSYSENDGIKELADYEPDNQQYDFDYSCLNENGYTYDFKTDSIESGDDYLLKLTLTAEKDGNTTVLIDKVFDKDIEQITSNGKYMIALNGCLDKTINCGTYGATFIEIPPVK